MARVEVDAEECVTQSPVDDGLERAADLADVQRGVPLGDRLEVWPDQAGYVVLDVVRKLRRVLDDESGSTVQGAPDAVRDCEAVTAFDRSVTRAEQTER